MKIDSKFTDNPNVTFCRTPHQYKTIHGGTDYLIHFKYSDLLNVTYITLMYGLAMPILFPLAALNLFNACVAERMVVAWIVK